MCSMMILFDFSCLLNLNESSTFPNDLMNKFLFVTVIKFQIQVKVTPISLVKLSTNAEAQTEDCLSLETMDLLDKTDCWPVVEVAVCIVKIII